MQFNFLRKSQIDTQSIKSFLTKRQASISLIKDKDVTTIVKKMILNGTKK